MVKKAKKDRKAKKRKKEKKINDKKNKAGRKSGKRKASSSSPGDSDVSDSSSASPPGVAPSGSSNAVQVLIDLEASSASTSPRGDVSDKMEETECPNDSGTCNMEDKLDTEDNDITTCQEHSPEDVRRTPEQESEVVDAPSSEDVRRTLEQDSETKAERVRRVQVEEHKWSGWLKTMDAELKAKEIEMKARAIEADEARRRVQEVQRLAAERERQKAQEEQRRQIQEALAACESKEEENGGETAEGPTESAGRLLESALYRENVLEQGHSTVWGSWFDVDLMRWGYACCRSLARGEVCKAAANAGPPPSSEPAQAGGSRRTEALTGAAAAAAQDAALLAPRELLPRAEFADAASFMMHWTAAVLHEWREKLRVQDAQVLADQRFAAEKALADTERSVKPLLRLLSAYSSVFSKGEAVRVWSEGNRRWMSGTVLEVLAADAVQSGGRLDGSALKAGSLQVAFDGGSARKWIPPESQGELLRRPQKSQELSQETLDKLENIAMLAVEGDYNKANEAYIEATMGNTRWHSDMKYSSTGCAKAPRNGGKVRRDFADLLDIEEVKEYMFCLKRLVAFLQLVRPLEDASKQSH